MECPYCKKEMAEGFLPNAQNAVRWYEKDFAYDYNFGSPSDGLRLTAPTFIKTGRIEAWYCEECRAVIIPVREFEDPVDKFADKVKNTFSRLGDAVDKHQEEWEEEKRARERDKRRKKDPWEV